MKLRDLIVESDANGCIIIDRHIDGIRPRWVNKDDININYFNTELYPISKIDDIESYFLSDYKWSVNNKVYVPKYISNWINVEKDYDIRFIFLS